ncbi:F-BAR and double SH3 domains protein 2 [Orchesella cincta]|uniref:F-BAR and double SH3 domains protein 2 n=1 Tax=Orchesella cincta TaxID=48709 RepID=A0A1D2NAG7_ORCCI|nr:F-BAR and double SH3 domains protein 2 [Orchesella cincta]
MRGPYLKTLKHVHTEQIARLQAKNQHECDLLEDIRVEVTGRICLHHFFQALLKLSSAYLNKKIPSIPDLRDEDEEEQWNVWNVWRTVLEENEKLARARLAAVEVFQQQITDDAKTIRLAKLSASKKCLDQLQVVQKEVQVSVSELDRFKKLYFEEEHLAHDARDKVRDVEEKLKKKKGSIFSSFTSLQRSSVKFSSKKEACEEKSTGARNDYIISLAIANAHQDRYFNVDLDGCIRTLEGDVYEKLKEYLTILGRTELLTCSAAQNSFTKIRDQAQMLSRDYNVMCCVQYYPVLKQHIRYPFDPCEGDHCTKITCDHGAGTLLSREAKKWATKVGKEVKIIRENQKKLVYLIQLKEHGNKTDPDDPNGPDLETRIEEYRETIRKSETEKCKAEAVIECLRDGDVNVDEWLQDIENLTTAVELARSASSTSIKTDVSSQPQPQEAFYDSDANNDAVSETFRENETSSAEPVERDEEVEGENHVRCGFWFTFVILLIGWFWVFIEYLAQIEQERKRIEALSMSATTWDDPIKVDWGDQHEEPSEEPPVASPPPTDNQSQSGHRESWSNDPNESQSGLVKCVAIYTYTAQNPDELSIVENEHLELIGEGDGDGWVRARNYKGEEGYVPQNYVEAEGNASMPGYPLQPQISFSSVDYHVQDPNAAVPDGTPDQVPLDSVTEGQETVVESVESSVGLYDYEATGPEELSFYEGQIVRILKRVCRYKIPEFDNNIFVELNVYFNFMLKDDEDGWWEGEYDGMKGIFPCIVVEECRWDGEPLSPEAEEEEEEDEDEEDISESGIQPPCYTPPEIPSHLLPPEKVIVTQPTPTVEHATQPEPEPQATSSTATAQDEPRNQDEFAMEMSGDQQQKYQTQFDDSSDTGVTPCATIVISEVPDVTISISGPEEDETEEQKDLDEDSGLGVAQIVITAATPMTEDAKSFPVEDEQPEVAEEEPEISQPPPPPPPLEEVVEETEIAEKERESPAAAPAEEIGGFADFSSGFDDNFADAFAPPSSTSQDVTPATSHAALFEKCGSVSDDSQTTAFEKVAFRRQSEPEDELSDLRDSPEDPLSSEPKVIEVIEPKEPYAAPLFQTVAEAKRAAAAASSQASSGSLEIDQVGKMSKITLGESNESPVTPEELDVQSLAKLESLKESDA